MKRILTVLLCIGILFVTCMWVSAESNADLILTPPSEVVSTAEQKMNRITSKFKSSPQKWNYSSEEEVDSLVLGTCYRMYYIGDRAEYASGDSIDELIDFSAKEVWMFTLESNGVPMGEIRVSYRDNEYYVMGYSGYDKNFADAYLYATQVAYNKGLSFTNKLISAGPNYYFILEGNESLLVPVVYSGSNFNADIETFANVVKTSIKEYNDTIKNNSEPVYGGANLTDKLRVAIESPHNFSIINIIIPVTIIIVLGTGIATIVIVATKRKIKAKNTRNR